MAHKKIRVLFRVHDYAEWPCQIFLFPLPTFAQETQRPSLNLHIFPPESLSGSKTTVLISEDYSLDSKRADSIVGTIISVRLRNNSERVPDDIGKGYNNHEQALSDFTPIQLRE